MLDEKDYTKLTLKALLAEEKKIKRNEIIFAVIIEFLICVIILGLSF